MPPPPPPAGPPDATTDEAALLRWVVALDEDALLALLQARPDLAWGAPPADLADLAERIAHPSSLLAALDEIDLPSSLVLNAVLMLGWGATAERLAELFGDDPDPGTLPRRLGAVLAQLTRRGLVVPGPGGTLVAVPGLEDVLVPLLPGRPLRSLLAHTTVEEAVRALRTWGPRPASSARAHVVPLLRRALSDPDHVRAIADQADPDTLAALHRFLARLADERDEEFTGYDPRLVADLQQQFAAARWAQQHGLLVGQATTITGATFSTEVVLGLLREQVHVALPPRPPLPATTGLSPEVSHRASAGALTEAVSVAMGVLEHVARTPVTGRKDGCIGAREVTRLAKALVADVRLVRWSLETAARRGLLERRDAEHTTSTAFEGWRRTDPGGRCADLLTTWLDSGTLVVRDRDLDDKPAAVFGVPTALRAALVRRTLLRHLVDLPPGRAVVSAAELFRLAGWFHPLALDAGDATIAEDVLAEAELLGVVAAGSLTAVGSALVSGDLAALRRATAAVLPGTGSTAVFGSDLTVLVAGNPVAHVVDLLDEVAVREARGAASSWRFTTASLRSALDAGHEAADLLAGLRDIAGGPLPQPLEYFVTDVARRYGRVGVRPAGAVLVGEEALLTELAADSALRRLQLRQVAPTVVLSAAPSDVVLDAVRRAGYLPRAEHGDGSPVAPVVRLQRHEPAPTAPSADAEPTVDPEPTADAEPTALAMRLVAGSPPPENAAVTELLATLRPRTKRLTVSERRQLAHAVAHDVPVRLVYRARTGDQVGHLEHPRFLGPTLLGDVDGGTWYLTVELITSVAPVGP